MCVYIRIIYILYIYRERDIHTCIYVYIYIYIYIYAHIYIQHVCTSGEPASSRKTCLASEGGMMRLGQKTLLDLACC